MKKRTTRKYNSELRERQKEMTRDLIMEAVCALINEGKIHEFSLQDVATRAGISYGSVYKNYPTKEALLEALYEWGGNLRTGMEQNQPKNLNELIKFNSELFRQFEDQADLRAAVLQTMIAININPKSMRDRTNNLQTMIEREYPHLEPGMSRRAAHVIRYIAGSIFWMMFRKRNGFDLEDTTASMEWAVQALLEDLNRKNRERDPKEDVNP